ncbi:MAG: DNA polymerase III subunit epsilon, partial [Rhodoferax sp.]
MNRFRSDRRLLLAMAVIGLATVVWLLLTIGLIASTLEPGQRALLAQQLASRFVLIGLTWVLGLVVIGSTLRWLFRRYASAPGRLLEQTQVLLAAPQAAPMNHQGTTETQA